MRGRAPRTRGRAVPALRAALLAASLGACGGDPPRPYAQPAGQRVRLEFLAREEIEGTAVARRIVAACDGSFQADGSIGVEVGRADIETRTGSGVIAATSDSGAPAGPIPAGEEAARAVVHALRAAAIRVSLDPEAGVVSVGGFDAALDAALARGDLDAETRDGLRVLCADAVWTRALPAAGLCAPPESLARRAKARRTANAWIPGRGVARILLEGEVGEDRSGLPTLRVAGGLAPGAEFSGDEGPAPPGEVGAVRLDGVRGEATTSYVRSGALPVRGEWTLTTPYSGGLTVKSTFGFKLVRP